MAQYLDYSRLRTKPPRPMRFADWGYVVLVAGSYIVAAVGYCLMPGGTHWSFDFERARFLSRIAAAGAVLLAGFGTVPLLKSSRRSVHPPVLVWATMASYALLLLLLVFGKWMSLNFS